MALLRNVAKRGHTGRQMGKDRAPRGRLHAKMIDEPAMGAKGFDGHANVWPAKHSPCGPQSIPGAPPRAWSAIRRRVRENGPRQDCKPPSMQIGGLRRAGPTPFGSHADRQPQHSRRFLPFRSAPLPRPKGSLLDPRVDPEEFSHGVTTVFPPISLQIFR
jgi:hypothetical protein